MTKERYRQLAAFADEIVDLFRERGIGQSESCIIRELAERQWNYTI